MLLLLLLCRLTAGHTLKDDAPQGANDTHELSSTLDALLAVQNAEKQHSCRLLCDLVAAVVTQHQALKTYTSNQHDSSITQQPAIAH